MMLRSELAQDGAKHVFKVLTLSTYIINPAAQTEQGSMVQISLYM